jgi:transposase-like protein
MSKKQFTVEQIITKLREAKVSLSKGMTIALVCSSLGVTEKTYYRWRLAVFHKGSLSGRAKVGTFSSFQIGGIIESLL